MHACIFFTIFFISMLLIKSLYIIQAGGGCNLHVHDGVGGLMYARMCMPVHPHSVRV